MTQAYRDAGLARSGGAYIEVLQAWRGALAALLPYDSPLLGRNARV